MTREDILFIGSILIKAVFFIMFVYLDRKTWSWKKGACVLGLIQIDSNYNNITSYSVILLFLIYTITSIISIKIIMNEKNQ